MATPQTLRPQMIDVIDIFVEKIMDMGLTRVEACKLIRHAAHVAENKRLPAVEGVAELGNADGQIGANQLDAVGV